MHLQRARHGRHDNERRAEAQCGGLPHSDGGAALHSSEWRSHAMSLAATECPMLTRLALQVGDHYKSPLYPIWVMGSQSHFTVLFSPDTSANEETISSKVLKAFSKYDEHGSKFIPLDKLKDVLMDLGMAVYCDWDCCHADGHGRVAPLRRPHRE